jgi:hypothetical protein
MSALVALVLLATLGLGNAFAQQPISGWLTGSASYFGVSAALPQRAAGLLAVAHSGRSLLHQTAVQTAHLSLGALQTPNDGAGGGACGYSSSATWPYYAVALSRNSSLARPAAGCGACLEVQPVCPAGQVTLASVGSGCGLPSSGCCSA